MKLSQLFEQKLNENNTPSSSIASRVESLVGKSLDINGNNYTITKVKHKSNYGDNYNLYVDQDFGSNHPYGEHNIQREISKLSGLKAQWSENGLQGDDYINMDFYPAKEVAVPNVASDLKKFEEFAASRGYETEIGNIRVKITRQGKGTLYFAWEEANDEHDGHYQFYKISGWKQVICDGSFDEMMEDFTKGFAKKYFTVPKAPKE